MRLVILMLIKDRIGIQECVELEWTEVSLVQASHFTEEENSGPDITQGTSSRAWPLGPSLLILNGPFLSPALYLGR